VVSLSVVAALTAELEALGPKGRDSSLAATALALAEELDADNSATSKSMCAKSMVDVLRELRSFAPPKREADGVTNLNDRREARRSAAAAHSARS
jgi:hypothetical protein